MFLSEGIDVVSLFDGMSCGRIALARSGIGVKNYYASEIDKHAIIVAKANWPQTQHMGDVTKWREWPIDWSKVKLILAGSPCQGFSSAGKQGGTKAVLDGVEYVVADRETYISLRDQGAKFLSQSYLFWEFVLCLDHAMSCNPDIKFLLENVKMSKNNLNMITDALGAEPVFINSELVSAQNRQRYYWANWEFKAPSDHFIFLDSVIESGVVDKDKSFSLDANYFKGGNLKQYFEKSRRQLAFELSKINPRGIDVSINEDGIRPHKGDSRKSGISELGRLIFRDAKKTYTLTTSHMPKIIDELGFRKLTPVECERLQTVPDSYTNHVSNTQRYKMLGNGWTVDVIKHILDSSGLHA